MNLSPIFDVTSAVAVLNQTLDYAFPTITVVGEISDLRVSKQKWIYFDLKDAESKLKCFGTVYQLIMPLESGMQVEIIANPKLHNLYGFSLNIQSIRPVGEGSIKKASDLLKAKLEKEGLFSLERKRYIPQAPARVGLISSEQSAGFVDFLKIMNARWQGTQVELYDVQVQGDSAPEQIVSAIHYFSEQSNPVEVVVIIRGGGSIDDLSAFSAENVVRAVSASRVPTLVAIGHEIDESLSELASDMRASTPSNAAELLFPDKKDVVEQINLRKLRLSDNVYSILESKSADLEQSKLVLGHRIEQVLLQKQQDIKYAKSLLESSHPKTVLRKGYTLVYANGKLISSAAQTKPNMDIEIEFRDAKVKANIEKV